MKILLTLFVLLFSSSVVADNISDFQIEGMSIGDSLLKYFTKSEIANLRNYDDLPSSMRFRIAYYNSNEFDLKVYDGLQILYKPEDNNFIIHGINGNIKCSNQKKCEKILNDILNDLSVFFKRSYITDGISHKHGDDKSGKSIYKSFHFELQNGLVVVQYIDWSNEVPWIDHVRLAVNTKEVSDWINNGYF